MVPIIYQIIHNGLIAMEGPLLQRWWKARTTSNLIGLDIGATSVKLLEINSAETPFLVKNFLALPTPPGALVKGEIKDTTAIANTLKDLFKLKGISTNDVAFAIPRSSVSIKNTTIDKRLGPVEIESRAWIEAKHHFPDLVGEIYLDYHILDPSSTDDSQLDLMLIACRKEQLTPYQETLRNAGLTGKIADVDCYALERALRLVVQNMTEVQTVALLNLNLALSSLVVLHENELVYAHDQTYDGYRLKAQVQEYLDKIPTTPTDEKKLSIDDAAYLTILKENLISHLRHSMHFFYTNRPNINIQKIVLSGECASIPCLTNFIQQEIGIETVLADPFTKMNFANHIDQGEFQKYKTEMMLCCGLALSKLR